MAQNISLKIFTPDKTALNRKVYRVVLPFGKTNLTLIEGRAPTSLLLNKGVLQILDESYKVTEAYFINGGVVDAAENVCKISTLRLIKTTDITLEKAEELANSEPQNAEFYQMVSHYFKTFA